MGFKVYLAIGGLFVLLTVFMTYTSPGRELRAYISGGKEISTYTACGCGGCGGTQPIEKNVYNREEFERLKKEDQAAKGNPGCAVMGCAICIKYTLKT